MNPFDIERNIERLHSIAARLSESGGVQDRSLLLDLRDGLSELEKRLSSGLASRSDIALQAYEAAPLGCALIDSKGELADVNQKFTELLGCPSDGLLKRQFSDFVAPESRDIFFRRCVVLFSGLSPESPCEIKMLKTSGERFFASIKGVPVSSPSGRMCLLFVTDVNAERTISLALAESERRFRLLFDQNPLGYLALNSAGCVAEANEAASSMLGFPREALIGRLVVDFVAPGSSETFTALLSALRRNGHVRGQTEIEMQRGSEREAFTASVCGNVGVDSHGLFTQTHLIVADISATRKADAERRLLAAAVEHASEGVVVTRVDGVILYANSAFEAASGSPRSSIVGARFGSFVADDASREDFDKLVVKQLSSGRPWSGRLFGLRGSGSYEMELTASPVKSSDGAVVNYVLITQDIAGKLKMERELRQSQKMQAIGTLAGGIAHDFNNILMAMMGYTEMALDTLGENHRAKVFLNQVLTSSRRARDLIKQILAFSRQSDRSLRPLQAGLVVKEALKLLRSTLPSSIKMKSSIKSKALCLADLTELHQVVMNLCTNAAHAMAEKGGTLEVSLEDVELSSDEAAAKSQELRPGRQILLSVRDSGEGIPRENFERIFEPFFTTKPAGEGTGMGLSVVHGIVKELKGHVEVESEMGSGSCFKVYIPAEEGVEPAEEEREFAKILGNGQKVLCVDDEPALAELISGMLQALNYKAVSASSPSDALSLFAQDPASIDAVITDHTMPDMTGMRLSREMLKLKPDLPVLLCTGFSGAILKGELADSGVRDILSKPVSLFDLGMALRKAIPQESAVLELR